MFLNYNVPTNHLGILSKHRFRFSGWACVLPFYIVLVLPIHRLPYEKEPGISVTIQAQFFHPFLREHLPPPPLYFENKLLWTEKGSSVSQNNVNER